MPGGFVSCNVDDRAALIHQLYPGTAQDVVKGDLEGQPKPPPATWRSDLARSVFLNSDGPNHKVKFVPTFWRLIKTNNMSNMSDKDCTHKILSAVFFMNFQLFQAIDSHTKELE